MRDHGGDLDEARAAYGEGDWLDLSTGINPAPYPLPQIPARAFSALPTGAEIDALEATAQAAYGTCAPMVALAGAQAAIQLVPRLAPRGSRLAPQGCARVLGPTYNEHRAALAGAGWRVEDAASPEALAGADLAVVVNPNNPDGRRFSPDRLIALAARVGLLVVDESFADAEPGLSLLPRLGPGLGNIVALRSFGKFYGHAGLRLGFAAADAARAERLRALAGPWPVSGPAVVVGRAALADAD
ncbi:aminotransferase class I/II-fold pyridoxal phosphate-dependent enzyme, partial [Methylocella sp.]|uniref:aminotransferase class I/II-fold pyridoxal phosphate-dependent enzyme n=1 Tax=Methylocella sp. TaxID=1978226 RepID=UPI0037837389